MKALICEMCSSNNLVKEGGVFICQTCGTKYSVEEAKRMMIEGLVTVKGAVEIDNSSYVTKCLENARRAKAKRDWEEVEKYYNLVEQNDPKNIEAIFYSSYGKAMLSLIDSDIYRRQQVFDVFCRSISVIDDNYDTSKSEENVTLISQMNTDLFTMFNTNFVYNTKANGYGQVVWNNAIETHYLFASVALHFIESLENILKVDNNTAYLVGIYNQYTFIINNENFPKNYKNNYVPSYNEVVSRLAKVDSRFVNTPLIKEAGLSLSELKSRNNIIGVFVGLGVVVIVFTALIISLL